jgi:hypothetical protein
MRVGASSFVLGCTVALSVSGVLAGLLLCATVSPLAAQPRGSAATRSTPSLSDEDQLAPSQMKQPMPARAADPPGTAAEPPSHPAPHAAPSASVDAPTEAPAAPRKPAQPSSSRTVIACSGPFAPDSGMLELAMVFGAMNMTYTEQKVQDGQVGVTVLYPKDPKRRLEIWWQNSNRTGLYLIDIAGKSGWSGPEGLRLGLTLPQLEKLNHKPFKLKGFDKDGVATVNNWDGGALATLPGGCKPSVSLHADAKVSADALGDISADQEFSSADPAIAKTKPMVSEILIGY